MKPNLIMKDRFEWILVDKIRKIKFFFNQESRKMMVETSQLHITIILNV